MPVTIEELNGPDQLRTALIDAELDTAKVVDLLKEELGANETKIANYQGKIFYSKDLTAWNIRQKARADLAKYLGLATDKLDLTGTITTMPRLTDEDRELIRSIRHDLRDAFIRYHQGLDTDRQD